eukprot:m.8844 g.8844  ORF g.8844 m.8844 type:complete len:1642 (+) comp6238_c0_seq1:253-5178(+)
MYNHKRTSRSSTPLMQNRGSSQSVSGKNEWKDPDYLHNRLGFPDVPPPKPFWSTVVLYLTQIVMFLLVLGFASWAKLQFLVLAYTAGNGNPLSVAAHSSGQSNSLPMEKSAMHAYAAICLAIICPHVWQLFWRFLRTPILGDSVFHQWPKLSTTLYIFFQSMIESAGVCLFALVVAPNLDPLAVLGSMTLVFFDPLYFFAICFGNSRKNNGLERVNENQPLINTFQSQSSVEQPKLWWTNLVKWGGYILQWACIIAVPVYLSVIEDTNMAAWTAPVSCVLLACAWSPSVQQFIDNCIHKEQHSYGDDTTNRHEEERGRENNENRRSKLLLNMSASTLAPASTEHSRNYIVTRSRDRAILLSHFFRCVGVLVFIPVLTYVFSDHTFWETGDGGLSWKFWINLDFAKYHDIVVSLLGVLLCSLAAYHLSIYGLKMGFMRTSFSIPMGFSFILTSGVVLLAQYSTDSNNKIAPFPSYLYLGDPSKWLLIVFVVVCYISMFCVNYAMNFVHKIPKLALEEALFFQPAFNSIFLEQYSLICRRVGRDPITDNELLTTDEELRQSKLYVCTTMYNEDRNEMKQLVNSIILSANKLVDYCQFESHIFMDGGMKTETQPGQAALRLIEVISSSFKDLKDKKKLGNTNKDVESKKFTTAYGMRVEIKYHKTKITVHLKNPSKVKKGKRWSQVMYMYYIIRYLIDTKGTNNKEKAYILATDADIMFGPDDVIALLMMMARDKGVGAVCGRTHPLGSGPLVWYQKFDYAVGHWFQKAAEHVLGTVLCCPGCFSLYRIDALRDVVLEYSTHVDKASEFLTKDMGEDRWLCTLLVLCGWRLDYCAAAVDRTYCPDDFKDFFNQRRRWIVSTVANMVEILAKAANGVRLNRSMSWLYVAYTSLMVGSMVVSPATVLLVMIGGFNYVLDWNETVVEVILSGIALMYVVICMYTKQKTQILVAKWLTVIFAIVMAVVFIGLLAQIADDLATSQEPPVPSSSTTTLPPRPTPPGGGGGGGDLYANETFMYNATEWVYEQVVDGFGGLPDVGSGHGKVSVSTIYLLSMIGMFLFAGFLHPKEFFDLIHGVWYLLCLPTGYLLLLIYACCNMNDRSWGTRETTGGTNLDGSVSTSTPSTTSWWKLVMYGCGLQKKESVLHFCGRVMCCKSYTEETNVDLEQEAHQRQAATKPEEKPLPWQIKQTMDEHGSTVYRVECEYVTQAVELLNRSDRSASDIHQVIKKALFSGPFLHEKGSERNATWARNWNGEVHALNNDFLQRLVESDEDAKDLVEDWEQTMDELSEELDQNQMSSAESLRTDFTRLTHGKHKLKQVREWVSSLDCSDANEDFLRERLSDFGYTHSFFLSYLKIEDLDHMGISELPNGEVLKHRIMAKVEEEKKHRVEYDVQSEQRFDTWLKSLDLGIYWAHFVFYGFQPKDITDYALMTLLSPNRLSQMGIVKRGHYRCLCDALKNIQKKLEEKKSMQDEAQKKNRNEDSSSWEEIVVDDTLYKLDERMFWEGVLDGVLGARDTGMQQILLKEKLDDMRTKSVLAMVIINLMWLILMIMLNGRVAAHLQLFQTNFLGVLFILTFGALFVLQFLTMVVHRINTFCQAIATLNNIKDSSHGIEDEDGEDGEDDDAFEDRYRPQRHVSSSRETMY